MPTAFSRSVKVFIDQNLTPKAQSAHLAKTARAGVAELISSGRASPRYEVAVDGRLGASEEQVKPLGTISYTFEYLGDVVSFAIGFLMARSPVLTGAYRDSFFIGVNGQNIPARTFDASQLPVGAEIFIYNKTPYSRKVDVQLIGFRKLSFSVPAGIFDDCRQAVNSRFGNIVSVKRVSNIDFPGKYALRQRQMRPAPRQHLVLRGAGELVESPGLLITLRGA